MITARAMIRTEDDPFNAGRTRLRAEIREGECEGTRFLLYNPEAYDAAKHGPFVMVKFAPDDQFARIVPKPPRKVTAPVFQGGLRMDATSRAAIPADRMGTPAAAAAVFRPLIGDSATEVFMVAGLNSTNKVLGIAEVCRGGFSHCEVDPRVLFTMLLMMGPVSGFIIAHNHPSGDPTPSTADIALTKQLQRAAQLLCIRLADHVIIGKDLQFSSLLTEGHMS